MVCPSTIDTVIHLSNQLVFLKNAFYLFAIIYYLSYNFAASQATNCSLASGKQNTQKGVGVLFEYTQLLVVTF